MRIALQQSWEPIVASGATVVLSVLCLTFADLGSTRGLGPISAGSGSLAVLAALTFLPAALTLLGRGGCGPCRPEYGGEPTQARGWPGIAALVGRRPRRVLLGGLACLLAAAAFAPT